MPASNRKPMLALAYAAALFIFVAIGWSVFSYVDAMLDSDTREVRAYHVRSELDAFLTAMVDAETGQRGFLITGIESYLEPYHGSLERIASLQASLRKATGDAPQQQERLDRLAPLVEKRLAILGEAIETRRGSGLEAAKEEIISRKSKAVMDEIRVLIADADRDQAGLLRQSAEAKSAASRKTLVALKAGGGVGFAILLTVFFLLNREIARRSRVESDLLSRNAELEESRNRERSQNWVKTGVNELNRVVRGDRHLDEMTGACLRWLSGYLKLAVGALYLFDEQAQTLRLASHFALSRGKGAPDTIPLGEGVAGEVARLKSPIYLEQVPPDYLVVASALGESAPRSVLALPLLHDGRLIGVMEVGSFQEFDPHQRDLLDQAAEGLAIAIGINQTRQRVNELLTQSQAQEEELRVQQEELQQSNEELEERAQLLERQREQIQDKNREMEEAGREILRKAREVEQISTYKSEFLANMSHELRTPLNSLMILSGHLQENREGNLTAKQVEYASTIKSSGAELLNLINDILDLSKIESGRLEFVFEELPLAGIRDQVAALFSPMAEQKGLRFGAVIERGVPEALSLDSQRTLQILKNLLSNALKFTREGSVALRIYRPEPGENPLGVSAVAFEVADTGIGIPADKQEIIFQAFQQADGSTSRKFGGTGLGLSISRQLARGMQGEILVSASEGGGSRFTLYLPISRPLTEAAAPGPAPLPAPAREGAPPSALPPFLPDDRESIKAGDRCVLTIEDDAGFARVLMDRLRERGYSVIAAGDGKNGVELAGRYLPSAILLDVMLPGLDGWGVMQKLKEDPHLRHIPVHFITCTEERQKALSMGAIGFITKPASVEQLEEMFRMVEREVAQTLRRLLIVEDDDAQAAALVTLLQESGIEITVARTGGQAIARLSSEQFDCIVLDLGLADMSGFDLLEHIRRLDEKRRIPVIIHTGRDLSPEETRRLQFYAESIIIKGAKSPERLLNEVTLFLHVMESRLPPDKQKMIRTTLDNEALLADKKVLLVDDDMRNVFSLSSVLAEKGMQIVEAENGRVALQKLDEHPDVNIVLMDVMMPEMDGLEATRLIRQDSRFARLPVIALTAKAMKGDREACIKAGSSDYITKPIDMDRLLSLLRVWLYHQG